MKTVNIGDIDLYVVDHGSGLPLLLVHGFPLDHSMWRAQIEELGEHCRVIAPDLRGFGRSPLGQVESVLSMQHLADDLAALLDALHVRDQAIFCGLSMGGYVGWQFWRQHSDRVRAMVPCDTRAVADSPEAAANRRELAARVLTEGTAPVVEVMLPKLHGPYARQHQPQLLDDVKGVISGTSPQTIAAALEGMAVRPDATEMLAEIDVPTLIVVGEHDEISTVDEMRTIADAIPEAQWLVVPQAGHLSPLENPAVFNEALAEFILQ